MTFKFAGSKAQVCHYCKFVVARTAGGLQATGRMAELLEIPTPLQKGVTGTWNGEQFEVEGRLQMDRAGAPGAPWQEILIGFPMKGTHTWVAYAQGRWYATNEQALPEGGVPSIDQLRPGGPVSLGSYGQWVVSEVGQRRVVSGEGELANVPAPGVITRYADISGAGGQFGTIDYGDGSEPPELYLGRQFDAAELKLDSGAVLDGPEAEVQSLECPNCGGDLPQLSQQSERVICQYCATASDITQGALSALGPAPKPPIAPYIPIGAEGNLRGNQVICCGFVIRSCMVEGEYYSWREYLLFAPATGGYQWLIEEDGKWQWSLPVEAGDVVDSGHSAMYNGSSYSAIAPPVTARVDYVIGEFYWKVEIGEQVQSQELQGPGGKLSREQTPTEVNYSFNSPVSRSEVSSAFDLAPPAAGDVGFGGDEESQNTVMNVIWTIVVIAIIIGVGYAYLTGSCGGTGGGGYYYYGK